LTAAVADAAARSAVQDAAELAAHALRLTPAGAPEHGERVLALARCLAVAGDYSRVAKLLVPQLGQLRGPALAEAHLLLGEGTELLTTEQHLAHAIAESADHPGLHSRALSKRSLMLSVAQVERIAEAEELATRAAASASGAHPDEERRAIVALAWVRILRGRAIDDLLLRVPGGAAGVSIADGWVERPAGVRMLFRGELPPARAAFERLRECADQRGEARSGIVLHHQLCELELRAGDAHAAARLLDEWDHWAALEREEEAEPYRTRLGALLAALQGVPARASSLAATVIGTSRPDVTWDHLEARRAAGLAALFERAPDRAAASFELVWQHAVRERVDDPGAFPVVGDLVEALVECGRLGEAREVIAWLEPLARTQRHPWGLATARRAAAVAHLAEGYDEAVAGELAGAAADYGALGLGFEQARTLLFLGRVQRRFKKRAAARESLGRARTEFERLGCHGWAELATAELARVSGRRPRGTGELTASEQRVAELVASGLSNKAVAAQLFVSVYTVEAHLSNVYAKLGIQSRTQLARRLAAPS
jgi:DNA-binding CsgD family transcriptional regulator